MVEHDHEMPPACVAARDEFSALLDGELAPAVRAEVDAHLAGCAACLRALDGMKRVSDLYAALPRVGAPDDLEARVRRAVRPNLLAFPKLGRRGWTLASAAAVVAFLAATYVLLDRERADTRPLMAKQVEMRSAAPVAAPEAASASVESALMSSPSEEPIAEEMSSPVGVPESADARPVAEELAPLSAATAAKMAPAAAPTPEPRTAATWTAAGREFTQIDGAWTETDGSGVNTTEVREDSQEFMALLAKFPELSELTTAEIPVVFRAGDGTWYRLLPKKK